MPEYVYALYDFLPDLEGEMSFHAGDRIEVVEKDDTFSGGWWKGRTLEGAVGLFPQHFTAKAPPSAESAQYGASTDGKMVSRFTMMDVQKAVEELRLLCADDDSARCASFASSDMEMDGPDFSSEHKNTSNSAQDQYQGAETKLAECSRNGCVGANLLKDDESEPQNSTSALFVLPPPSNLPSMEVSRNAPERSPSPARLSLPTSTPVMGESFRPVPLSVPYHPLTTEVPLSGLSLPEVTDSAGTSLSEYDAVICASLDNGPSLPIPMHEPSKEDKKGKEIGNRKGPSDWTVAEVAQWLKSKGLDQAIVDKFVEEEITGDILLKLDTNLLKTEIGVMALGKRIRIANAITDLRQSPSETYTNRSMTEMPAPPPPLRHAASSSLHLLSRKQSQSQSHHSFPETSGHNSSRSLPVQLGVQEPRAVAEIGSYSTNGNGNELEIPLTISETVPAGFELPSSLAPGHTSSKGANNNHPMLSGVKRHSRARYTLGGSKASASERLEILAVPGDNGKSPKPPTAHEMGTKRPSTFSLPKGIHIASASYFQRPSTSSGLPNETRKGPQLPLRESRKGKEKPEETPSTNLGTLRKRLSISAWRSRGSSMESKSSIEASSIKQGQSFYDQIGVPDHSGWMRKKDDRYNVWKPRYFVLKGQRLYWLKNDNKSEARLKGFIDVMGYRITVDETLDTGRYGFRIDHDQDKTHLFSSDGKSIIREWMKAILKATISRDCTKPVISSAHNIQTIPLTIAQAMKPRPPSPTARDATQRAHRRNNPSQLSNRDARVLGFSSTMGENGISASERENTSSSRSRSRESHKPLMLDPADNNLVEWANSHLPSHLQIHDTATFFGGLSLLRLAESIKGQRASPPVPDRAFPPGPANGKPDGLFHLLDFLLGSGVKMGGVSINDIRLGRRDKILELLKSLKAWEEKRKRVVQTMPT